MKDVDVCLVKRAAALWKTGFVQAAASLQMTAPARRKNNVTKHRFESSVVFS